METKRHSIEEKKRKRNERRKNAKKQPKETPLETTADGIGGNKSVENMGKSEATKVPPEVQKLVQQKQEKTPKRQKRFSTRYFEKIPSISSRTIRSTGKKNENKIYEYTWNLILLHIYTYLVVYNNKFFVLF